MSVPVVLFAIAAVASTIVWQKVDQLQTAYASTYLQTLLQFLSRDYFFQPGDFWAMVSAAVILEGLALYVAVAALCRSTPFFERALRMLTWAAPALRR